MKNKIVLFSLTLVCVFSLNNCNDGFMNRAPLDEISDEVYWNTEQDVRNYNNSIYLLAKNSSSINIANEQNLYNRWFMDMWSDNLAADVYQDDKIEIKTGDHQIPSSPRNHGYDGWDLVREINVGLENYDKVDIAPQTLNQYVGEARFFRAWFYGDKVQFFGDVNWIGKPLNVDSEELYAERTPREQVMDSVLADINFAVENLPERWPEASSTAATGRINKWHALLIKSRLCLFEGTWRKYHGGSNPNAWLAEAEKAAKQLIDNGPYEIFSTGDPDNDYRSFHAESMDLSGNPEVMYWRDYEVGVETHMIHTYWHHFNGASKDFVDDYLLINGDPPVTTQGINPLYEGDETIENVFENRDPRMRQSILHPDDAERYRYFSEFDQPQLVGSSAWKKTSTGYTVIKYFNRDMIDLTWGQITSPVIVMRYAEALLNYAEAKAELGEITQNDLDISINKLRDRVNMPHLELNNVPDDPRYEDISPLITEIRRERRIELFAEGFRYLDLKRWKQGEQLEAPESYMGLRWTSEAAERYDHSTKETSVIVDPITGSTKEYVDAYKGTPYENPQFDDNKHYLWPLPLNIISQNENIEQNPGW